MQIRKVTTFAGKLNENLGRDTELVKNKQEAWKEASEQSLIVIMENLIKIGQEIIEVSKFSELNLTAIRKILKKYDKLFKNICLP